MATIIEKTGKTLEDALQDALNELGVSEQDVEVEVIEKPSKGFLGFGAKPAKIKVTLKEKIQPEKVEQVEKIKVDTAPPVEEVSALDETPQIEEVHEVEDIQPADVSETENIPESKDTAETTFDKAEVIEKAKTFLADVLKEMKIEAEINVEETESNVVFDLVGKNLGVLIGKHGQTLDALQYLTNLAANRNDSENRVHFVLDVENYRARRAETLQKLAKSVADRAVRMRQEVKLEPMNRHERRIIHTALQNNDRVETRSVGEEPYRYIIVSPKRRGR